MTMNQIIPEEISKLTPEEKRIRISTVDGWNFLRVAHEKKSDEKWNVYEKNNRIGSIKTNSLPDYLNDRDAIREAAKSLPLDVQYKFGLKLHEMACQEENTYFGQTEVFPLNGFGLFALATLSAGQLADAFLAVTTKSTEKLYVS